MYYSVKQLAEKFGTTPVTIRRWYYTGRLKGTKLSGGCVRFSQEAIEEFVRGCEQAQDRAHDAALPGNAL